MNRVILARDASAAWLENLPELRVSFCSEAEVDTFIERAALAGLQILAEGTDVIAQLAQRARAWS